jgi:hypothetical protein
MGRRVRAYALKGKENFTRAKSYVFAVLSDFARTFLHSERGLKDFADALSFTVRLKFIISNSQSR